MNASPSKFGNPEPEQRDANSVKSRPTRLPEESSCHNHGDNPECTVASANDARPPRSIRQRKRMSQRRIDANRRNARRSTGPRTARGKKTVSRNAIKHGLLAREVVINEGDGQEDQNAFDALYARIWEDYEPVGQREELLVERIVTCWWRLARVHRAETGEIRRHLDSTVRDVFLTQSDEVSVGNVLQLLSLPEARELFSKPWFDSSLSMAEKVHFQVKYQSDMKKHSAGIVYLKALLENAKTELAESGFLRPELGHWLVSAFVACNPMLIRVLSFLIAERPDRETPGSAARDELSAMREHATALIDHELATLHALEECATWSELSEIAVQKKVRSLPSAERADKILRSETHVERQLYRAMHELERLQRRRKGEDVPAPINVRFG
jgi:hypothetical protein